jgi:2-polyprenyl-3-methyl-5-hydroxy-6-metoxy-1,4-benzoquinol methylase
MAIYRTNTEHEFKTYGKYRDQHVTIPDEWGVNNGQERINDTVWLDRYKYEANIISSIIKDNNYQKILELGSGPGVLGQFVIESNPNVNYTFVDKINAKEVFEQKAHKGKFHVKDLMNSFDISGLDHDYDMVIANDFLEHIANPSDVLYKCREITKDNSIFFISVPNWRMGHDFIYRGLFDYDNFIYFSTVHGWKPVEVAGSPLRCNPLPKETSEQTLPDDLVQSWNWYFINKKILQ